MNRVQRIETSWVWLWYVRNWQQERDSMLKVLTYSLGIKA